MPEKYQGGANWQPGASFGPDEAAAFGMLREIYAEKLKEGGPHIFGSGRGNGATSIESWAGEDVGHAQLICTKSPVSASIVSNKHFVV